MSDILGYTEPFADFMTGKGMRFLLIAYDGDEVALNYNVDDEITAASVMPSIDALTYRYDRRLPTFVTTNLAQDPRDGETLRQRYGDRLADRFNEMFKVIGFYNQSYR